VSRGIGLKDTFTIGRSVAAFGVNLAATVILIAAAVAASHTVVRLLLALAACAAALATAVRLVAFWHYGRPTRRG
jgi:hypothetical protein